MELSVSRVQLLYGVGVVLGILAAFYFAFILLEDLSPTVTAAMLLLGFLVFAVAGLYAEPERLDIVSYALAAGSYVIFLAYTITTFDLSDVAVFLLLAGSSAMFILLGFLSFEGYLEVNRQHARLALGVLLLGGIVLVGVDVVGPQPTYEQTFEDAIEIPELRTEARLGTVTIHNPFVLSRTTELPRYHACLVAPDTDPQLVPLRYDENPRSVFLAGGESNAYELLIGPRGFYEDDELREPIRDAETIPVETTEECPEHTDEVKLVIVRDSPEPPIPLS